ncbi:MAG: riboflavin synthase [Desulfobacteraceae bacterium 4572_35.2]|nr:MAG: riboflavin synthase [Desulfobacteraceae bacterium 4572_35.2]
MFTGLIEDVGTVRSLRQSSGGARLEISTQLPLSEVDLGDSIAVNGICLTVVGLGSGSFVADVSPETLSSSSLAQLSPASSVNLERALRLSDRLGGHLVSGHVDDIAEVISRQNDGNATLFTFRAAENTLRYVVEKGSITIDGVSLTVNLVTQETFGVSIIPHSLVKTTLNNIKIGCKVNIETDIIARYVEKLMMGRISPSTGSLTMEHLAQNGFV